MSLTKIVTGQTAFSNFKKKSLKISSFMSPFHPFKTMTISHKFTCAGLSATFACPNCSNHGSLEIR